MLDVVTIAGSPAAPSRCEAALAWARQDLARRGLRTAGVNVRDLDPQALLWGRLGDPDLRAAADLVESARGVIIATPVYKAAYAGILKAFVDLLPPDALAGKTILPIATAGSLAHCLVLDYAFKPVVAALGARHVLAGVCLLDGDFAYADGAVDLVGRGADELDMRRGLPLTQARDPDTLLVLRMNGAPLPAAHGGPVRLLVPGWAGIASTKWLIGIEILDRAFAGRWNADNYVIRDRDGARLRPMAEMPVKSLIGAPRHDETLPAGWTTIAGYAWSDYGAIERVDVSVDGGSTWRLADRERAGRRSWDRFHLGWDAVPGRHRLLARATDERGLRQPRAAAWNGKGYGQNSIHAVEVVVEA
jgi:FMN reductase